MKKNKLPGLEGFTLTETLTAVIILLTCSAVFLTGTYKMLHTFEKISEKVKLNTEIILWHKTLKEAVGNIRPPFWERGTASSMGFDDGTLRLPYFKGNKDSILKVKFGTEGFNITYPDGTNTVFTHLTRSKINPLPADDLTIGITTALYLEYEDIVANMLFGAWTLEGEAKN